MNYIPKVIGHRGASATAPENTLAAFELAFQEGADGLECDVRLTTDGQVICMHDADAERVAGTSILVADQSYEQLSELDVGAWKGADFKGTRIPLLSELLGKMRPGKKLLVELKTGQEILKPLFDVIDASSIELKQLAIMVFDPEMVKAILDADVDLNIWTVDDAAEARRYASLGVSSITTNCPKAMLAAMLR